MYISVTAVTICNINGEKAETPPPFSSAPVTTDIPRKDIKLDSRPVYGEKNALTKCFVISVLCSIL